MGSNNLNTDCSCHAPSVLYNQAVLSCSVTTTETLVVSAHQKVSSDG